MIASIFRTFYFEKYGAEYYENGTTFYLYELMHKNYIDLAVFYCTDMHLYRTYEITPNVMENYLYWVLPRRKRDVLDILLSSNQIVIFYIMECALISFAFWIIAKHKNISYYNKFISSQMAVITISLYQPIENVPKKTWLRYFIIFCVLMFINMNVAIQSQITYVLTLPSYKTPTKNIYELASTDLPMLIHKQMFRQLTENLDKATVNRIKQNYVPSKAPPTENDLINNTDKAILTSSMQLNYIRNLQDVQKFHEVRMKCD